MILWIGPTIAPLYCGLQSLCTVHLRDADRAAAFGPAVIQIGVLFVVTAIVISVTKIMTLRVAAGHASADARHRHTRQLVEKAMKTAALQFISSSVMQVSSFYSPLFALIS